VFRKIVYSSPVEGLIHWDGKPLEGVVVTRSLRSGGFKNGEYEDNTTTDAKGSFKLPVVEERRLFRPDLLSANPRIDQSIHLEYEGHEYSIWSNSKRNFYGLTETDGGVIRLTCDISDFEDFSFGRVVRCPSSQR